MYRRYDHRIKRMIHKTKNPNLFPELNIPRSTAMTWIKNGIGDIVTIEAFNRTDDEIITENLKLKEELEIAKTKHNLALTTFRIFGFEIQYKRLPSGIDNSDFLGLIKRSMKVLSLKICLEVIGLSVSRYNSWIRRSVECDLDDKSPCPRLNPTRLTYVEKAKIRGYVTAKEYAHYSIKSLSFKAKRNGDVFSSPSTWGRIIKEFNLRRPRKRVYPAKPRIGIRATKVNEIWHLDQTIYRLIDGTRCFIQSIIDNKSRFILAHSVTKIYGGVNTKDLLLKAIDRAKTLLKNVGIPNIFCDSGVENINSNIDGLINNNLIQRTIAGIDIEFSNSMIEALFRSMKHNYLYLKDILGFESLKSHVNFYVTEHNEAIPHSALDSAIPIEIYLGKWNEQNIRNLNIQSQYKRRERLRINKSLNCGKCPI